MTIVSLMGQIKSGELVLPAIQRDFVWGTEKIEKLFDSILREYPVGIVLLWETYDNLLYRHFEDEYKGDTIHTFHKNQGKRIKLVLDGQQRLNSLYISLYGNYKGSELYFDVLSGRDSQDFTEDKFIFSFLDEKEAEKLNVKKVQKNNVDSELEYYVKVKDLIVKKEESLQKLEKGIKQKLKLEDSDELRLRINLRRLKDSLNSTNILADNTIDEGKPSDDETRKSESDILEAFVRINREGTPLSRSDLIFSMIKLNWEESAKTLPEFLKEINEGNSFELDSDFVIRCLFAVSDLGTKFDVDLLRKKDNVEKIKKNYDACCNSIKSTIDFIQQECWVQSSDLFRGYNNFVPFVYYLFHTKNHQVPNNQIDRVRKAVYLLGFTSPFSRHIDSRLARYIRDDIKPLVEKKDNTFPLEGAVYWVWYWAKIESYGANLIQGNYPLVLHLLQKRSGAKVKYSKNAPEIDHIFPSSKLEQKGFKDHEINHFANFWILAENKNLNKTNKDPKEYFKDVSDADLKRAFIDRDMLEYSSYRKFLKDREEKILARIKKELDLSNDDYSVRAHWTDID